MVIFHSYVSLPEGIISNFGTASHPFPSLQGSTGGGSSASGTVLPPPVQPWWNGDALWASSPIGVDGV